MKQQLASHAVNLEDAVLAIASTCKDCKLHNTVALLSLSNKVISYFQQFKLSFTTETPACVQGSKQRDTRSIGSLFTTAAIKFLCSLITCSVLVIQTWWPLQPSIHQYSLSIRTIHNGNNKLKQNTYGIQYYTSAVHVYQMTKIYTIGNK